jgi:hypothetical protein
MFVNERLARHYGVPNVTGDQFVRVDAPPGRGGVLTQASILMLSSNATRTSPVKRGKFILEQILASPPPEPPANVPAIEDKPVLTGTLRQVMEQHRENPLCASCHQRMDPIGFAFENFDAIGAWRDVEASGAPIDASGELPDGQKFDGPEGLKKILREKQDLVANAITEKMLTYATGRGMESFDRCTIDKIILALEDHEYKFSTLILEVIKSDPFQRRTAVAVAEAP